MFSAVMTVLFALVMMYVWQHFSAVELGYRLAAQKTQVEQMRETNRELLLSQAQLEKPERIDRIAKQLGLDAPQPGQVVGTDGAVLGGPVMASAGVVQGVGNRE